VRGSEAQPFIRQISARVAGVVPYRLLDEASWATQGCAPLFRSAITFSARRALAAGIRRSTCSAVEAVYLEPRDQPAPDPARCFDCPVDPAPAAKWSGLLTAGCSAGRSSHSPWKRSIQDVFAAVNAV